MIFKVNLPVAVATTLYSNPFTIVPIYIAAYTLGEFAIRQSGDESLPPAELHLLDKNISEWVPALVDWISSLGKPLLVGLLLLGLLLSFIGYFTVRAGWRFYAIYVWPKRAQRHR